MVTAFVTTYQYLFARKPARFCMYVNGIKPVGHPLRGEDVEHSGHL